MASGSEENRERFKLLSETFDSDELDKLIKLRLDDQHGGRVAIERLMADTLPRREPVEEYIEDREERVAIFHEFQQSAIPDTINASTLAVFMVAPLVTLRSIKETRQNVGNNTAYKLFMQYAFNHAAQLMATYVPKEQDMHTHAAPTTPHVPSTPAGNPPSGGNRDDDKCVITGTPDPIGAHILAFTNTAEPKTKPLQLVLSFFWGGDEANWFKALIRDGSVTESVQNRLSLNHQLHHWWSQARFALKPLRKEDDNSITVQFHWLKRSGLTPSKEMSGQDVLAQAGLDGDAGHRWGPALHAHRMSGFPLLTGQTFVIRAEDKSNLPSFELLQLQWDLHRVAAICGAANVADDEIRLLFEPYGDEPDRDYDSDEYYMDSEEEFQEGA